MSTASATQLQPEIMAAIHIVEHDRHYSRMAVFVLLYLIGAGAACGLQAVTELGAWRWLAAVPFYLLAAAALHGISLFTHEAVHHTLSQNRWWNWILGAACAIPVLQNCTAYRVLHLRHHAHLGDDGDPDHYANYTRWTWMIFLMNWLRLMVGYPVYIVLIPILGFKHGTGKDRVMILCEIGATLAAVALVLGFIPVNFLVHGWLIPMVIINSLVNIRGMSQHTLLDPSSDEIRGTRSILTSRLVKFFMCNENFHLEHHLYPGVPWYHLPKVHSALRQELYQRGAPYIPSYFSFLREFVRHSIRRSPLGWKHSRKTL